MVMEEILELRKATSWEYLTLLRYKRKLGIRKEETIILIT